MLGKPKYKRGDLVEFELLVDGRIVSLFGEIFIVDAFGTFEQRSEVSYDIMVEKSHFTGGPCLYKHIEESRVVGKVSR